MVDQSKYGKAASNVDADSRLHSVIMIMPPAVLGGMIRTIVTACKSNGSDAPRIVCPSATPRSMTCL